ncbi:unnamed protein product, partial [marine sediment metagenome]
QHEEVLAQGGALSLRGHGRSPSFLGPQPICLTGQPHPAPHLSYTRSYACQPPGFARREESAVFS